jgi:FkbM family methyltransferase
VQFGGFLGLMLFRRAVYSDLSEESLLRQHFEKKTSGSFLDVGANDPENAVSRFLWGDWDGVIVEPLPRQAERFRKIPGLKVAEVALTSPEKAVDGYAEFSIAGKQSTLLPEKLMDRGVISDRVAVRTTSLEQLLTDQKIQQLDFLSVDVEGSEIEVLGGFDLERFRVGLLLVEDWGRDFQLHRLLRGKGYKRVRRTGFNSWYVPSQVKFPVSVWGRLQLFKKYVLGAPFKRLRKWRHDRKTHGYL